MGCRGHRPVDSHVSSPQNSRNYDWDIMRFNSNSESSPRKRRNGQDEGEPAACRPSLSGASEFAGSEGLSKADRSSFGAEPNDAILNVWTSETMGVCMLGIDLADCPFNIMWNGDNTWNGDYSFLLRNLVLKDFRTRYRNMSLGIFWSLVNPLVMMGVMTFVFTKIFPSTAIPKFPVFVLCGLVPFNFFSLAWGTGTTSMIDNASLIKRVPVPREVLPISSVLGNAVHLCIQGLLLLFIAIVFGVGVNRYWLLIPVILALEVVFSCGCVLLCSALDVYIRDMRYMVESTSTVLFWLVPIFYSFSMIRPEYVELYRWNPLAAVVLALRAVILEAQAPPMQLMVKLFVGSFTMFAIGWYAFRRLSARFYDYL